MTGIMARAEMVQRWQGCVIGQCLGDALGFAVEGYPPRECRSYVDGVLRARRAGQMGRAGFPFGQYTDDSQLLREMLQSFVCRGHWDPADYARRIGAIFVEERIVGRGSATEQAALRLAAGTPWEEAGTPSPSAGNGSAMRAAGGALMQPRDREVLAAIAHGQGRITHQDARCSAGAAAIAAAVARGLRGETPEPAAFCADVADLAGRFDQPARSAARTWASPRSRSRWPASSTIRAPGATAICWRWRPRSATSPPDDHTRRGRRAGPGLTCSRAVVAGDEYSRESEEGPDAEAALLAAPLAVNGRGLRRAISRCDPRGSSGRRHPVRSHRPCSPGYRGPGCVRDTPRPLSWHVGSGR